MSSPTIPPSEVTTESRHILSVIYHQSNPVQGEWVTDRQIKQTLCAYGPLSPETVEDELNDLANEGLIIRGEEGNKLAPGVGRPRHPGEI